MIMILMLTKKKFQSNQELLTCKKQSLFIIEIRARCLNKEKEENLQVILIIKSKTMQTSINLPILCKKDKTKQRKIRLSKIKHTTLRTIKMMMKKFLLKTIRLDNLFINSQLNPKQKGQSNTMNLL